MRVIRGQILLVLCCFFYLIWWYRCYQPGMTVSRVSGLNGLLFLLTALFGVTGVVFSLAPVDAIKETRINPSLILAAGIAGYAVLFLITRFGFSRTVTTELFLIVGWTTLEVSVANRLNAAGILSGRRFAAVCFITAAAFAVSMILYVAYYRMEAVKAFYSAMVPLAAAAAAMTAVIVMIGRKRPERPANQNRDTK